MNTKLKDRTIGDKLVNSLFFFLYNEVTIILRLLTIICEIFLVVMVLHVCLGINFVTMAYCYNDVRVNHTTSFPYTRIFLNVFWV